MTFIIGLQSWLLGGTANPASDGQIFHATQLLNLKANDENVFCAHFVFIWVKRFR